MCAAVSLELAHGITAGALSSSQGRAATGASCTSDGVCASCDAGFTLCGIACQETCTVPSTTSYDFAGAGGTVTI